MKRDIDEILASYFGNEPLTAEEKQLLQEWKEASASQQEVGRLLEKLRNQRKTLAAHESQRQAFEKIRKQVAEARRRRRRILWSSCAATVAMLIGCYLLLSTEPQALEPLAQNTLLPPQNPVAELILPSGEKRSWEIREEKVILADTNAQMNTSNQTLIVTSDTVADRVPQYYTLNIPYGAEYNVRLPDGTKIYLNAGTTLRYPDYFADGQREVYLSGEAFFEVASDSLHPFVVHVDDVAVRVLGTSFNVNAYPETEWIKTTLVKGRVETQCGDERFMMKPGTQVAYNKASGAADYFPVDTELYTSWKDGYYSFEEMPLGELMTIFTRWYDVDIEFADPGLKEIPFSGRLKRYEDLALMFKRLEYTGDVVFRVEKNRIVIEKKLK